MNQSTISLIFGTLSFLNPFRKGFSHKEALVYCSRRQGPTGLWEKLPELHYCLFNRGKEHLLKTDVELQAGKVNPSKKAIILITDDAKGQVAGFSLGDLVEKLKSEFNVAVVYLHENPRNIQPRCDVVTVGPLVQGDPGAVVAEEIKCLQNISEVECVLAISLECEEVLPNVWELGLLILHYIPEFLLKPKQAEWIKMSRRDATLQLFPNEEIKAKAYSAIGMDADRRSRVLESIDTGQMNSAIKRFSKEAQSLLAEERKECSEIKEAGFFDAQYAYPQIEVSGDRSIRDFLTAWRSGWKPKKPCPGFHPGIYRDHHPELTIDPTVDFIRQRKPKGPWLTEVISDRESDRDRGGSVREAEGERESEPSLREEARRTAPESQPQGGGTARQGGGCRQSDGDSDREYIAVGGAWIDPSTAGPQRGELNECERVKVNGDREPRRAALHLHLHYTDGMEGVLHKIKASRSKPDLFISVTSEERKVRVKEVLEKCQVECREITVFANRGRDIGPFLTGFGPKLFRDYEIVGHLHSKKSPHANDDYLQNWVKFLEKGLVGEKGSMMDAILSRMSSDPSIGIVYPDDPGCFGWEGNYSYGKALIERMRYEAPKPDASMNFPVGTMFWARTTALKSLLDLNLQWEDYPEEPIPIDGSMLHAMERIFGILPGLCGFRSVVTAVEGIAR